MKNVTVKTRTAVSHTPVRTRLMRDDILRETFSVEERKDDHGTKLWCGDNWYLPKELLGKTINPDPFTTVIWTLEGTNGPE